MTEAHEIGNKIFDSMLSPKFSTQAASPQLLPQGVLGGRRGFAIFAGVDFDFIPGLAIDEVDVVMRAGVRFYA